MKKALILSLKNPWRKNKIGGSQDILGRVLAISRLGYETDIIAIDNEDQLQYDKKSIPDNVNLLLFKKEKNLLKCLKYPFATSSRFQKNVINFLSNKIYDIAICETEFLYPYWKKGYVNAKHNYLRMHNIESNYYLELVKAEKNKLKSIIYSFDSFRLRINEKKGFPEFEKLLFISEREMEQFKQTEKKFYLPASFPLYSTKMSANIVNNNNEFLIFGDFTLDINKNGLFWFIEKVWPILLKENSNLRLILAGNGSETFKDKPNTIALGYVQDIDKLFDQVQIVLIPLLEGAGVKIKLVEALLRKKTIITTSKGVEGTSLVDGEHLFVCDDCESFANKCLYAINNIKKACDIANNGYEYAKKFHSIEAQMRFLENLFNKKC